MAEKKFIDDETIIERSNLLFVTNIKLNVKIDSELLSLLKSNLTIRRYAELKDEFGPELSNLFCIHFKEEHNPIDFLFTNQVLEASIDLVELHSYDQKSGKNLFKDSELSGISKINWRSFIQYNGIGLLIAKINTSSPLSQSIHRKLTLIYLNYPIIRTTGLEYLFKSSDDDGIIPTMPRFITIEQLLHRYKIELVSLVKQIVLNWDKGKRKSHCILPAPMWKGFQSISMETVIPIINLVVKSEGCTTAVEWIQNHQKMISYYLIKPELFELGELDSSYIQLILDKKNIWSINKNSAIISNYHGIIRIVFQEDDIKVPIEYSGFYMNSYYSFLYTTFISLINYFTLRIFDNYLDQKTDLLIHHITHDYILTDEDNKYIKKIGDKGKSLKVIAIIRDIKESIQNQLEEVLNVDKIIDSAPHIQLANIINDVFELSKWRKMIFAKIEELNNYTEIQDYINHEVNSRKLNLLLLLLTILSLIAAFLEVRDFFIGLG